MISQSIIVGSEYSYPPYSLIDANGNPTGFSVELLNSVLGVMELESMYTVGTWNEVKQALIEGDIDVLPVVGRTLEREEVFDFTFPYLTMHGTIVVREGTPMPDSYAELQGKKVGVMKGDNAEEYIRRNKTEVKIVLSESFEDALTLLSRGEIDAVIIQSLLAYQLLERLEINNLNISEKILQGFKQSFCFAVTEGNHELLENLNEGLAITMSNGTFDELQRQWFTSQGALRKSGQLLIVGGDEDFPPYEYIDENGEPAGYNVELTKAIARHMDLNIQIELGPWSETYNKMLNGEIDIIQGLFYSLERDKKISFSQPHMVVNHVAVTRDKQLNIRDIGDLKTLKILVMRDDIVHEILIDEGLNEQIALVKSQEEALRRLAGGEGDCVVISQISANYWIERSKITNLFVGTNSLISPEYNYGTLKSNNRSLLSFNEGLTTLQATGEYRKIYSKWLGVYETTDNWNTWQVVKLVLLIISPLIIILLLVLLWSISLKKVVRLRTREIEESETRMRTMFEQAPMGMALTESSTGNILEVNSKFEKILGFSSAEFTHIDWMSLTHPDDIQKDLGNMDLLQKGEISGFTMQKRYIHKDGSIVWTNMTVAPVNIGNENSPQHLCMTEDITMYKKTEQEKEELQQQLNHKSKMDAIGELAGGMAHDFNNVLSSILGASQLLKLPKHQLNEKSLKYVEMIIQASIRASDLISKLLAFSRKGKIVTTTLDIHNILDNTVEILEGTIDKKITISLTKHAHNNNSLGDLSALESAFINLGINASHAMPDGGAIQIKTKNILLDQKYCDSCSFGISPGDFIQIEIKDTGCGIPKENIHKIFEPFYTTKEQGTGTGLGLSAVYGTIQDHHGVIEVKSEEGSGTTFYIVLPCSKALIKDVKEISPILTGSGTILLVDDEEMNRILNKDILESLGYRVILAENGLESVEIFRKKHSEIDIVLMDMIMPKMNGSEAYYKLKEIDENCKVLISSGYTQDENIDELIKNGMAGFINKPFKISEISQLLDNVYKKN